jgi:segregation and condensation protein B
LFGPGIPANRPYLCRHSQLSPLEKLPQQIESLIFATDHPVRVPEILEVLEEAFGARFPEEEILQAVETLRAKYADEAFAFELVEINEGYQFLTKGAYHHTVGIYLKQTTRKRLSRSAIETLSIVAYKQPVTKTELEKIRGVSCDYALQKLLEKELVTIVGRAETPGRPLLYGTSDKFMDYFGLKSLQDLPTPKEFKLPENTIGEGEALEEE